MKEKDDHESSIQIEGNEDDARPVAELDQDASLQ